MGMPPRHGHRWSKIPTPLSEGASPLAMRGELTPTPVDESCLSVIPTKLVDFFLRSLPQDYIHFYNRSEERQYDHSLPVGGTQVIATLTVSQGYVWVINDAEFYATGPRPEMMALPLNLNSAALLGMLRLDLLISGMSPLQSGSHRLSPYTSPAQSPVGETGWPWLERPFGTQRMPSFALFAKEGQTVEGIVTVEAVPRFPITRIGFNLHGFTVPAAIFQRFWSVC